MSWLSRLRNTLHPQRLDSELLEELRDHVDRRAEALIAEGLTREDAYRRATAMFGNQTLLRERARESRLSATLDSLLKDWTYAWRGLMRSPALTLTVVLSLGLAVGANTAIYSIVNAALMRPLPLPSPDRLFTLSAPQSQPAARSGPADKSVFSYPQFLKFSAAAGDAAALAFFSGPARVETQIQQQNGPVEIATDQFITGEAFRVLQVRPALGQLFSAADDRGAGIHPEAVLSSDYWHRRFHSDPAIVGQVVYVDSRPFRVKGVAQEGFFGVEPGKFIDLWLPVSMFDPGALSNPAFDWGRIVGRLESADPPLKGRERLQARLRIELSKLEIRPAATGVSEFRQTFQRPLWIVLAAAAGILLIACSNVASLLLARSTARGAEMGLRVSLGAGRIRLILQTLIESLVLAALSGCAGWILARWGEPVLIRYLGSANNPLQFVTGTDTGVVLFCAGICVLCAVLFGMAPAWQAAVATPMSALRNAGGQARKLRIGRVFVGMQVAFAFCLVAAGAGFLFSLHNLFSVDTGFDPKGVMVTSVGISRGGPQLPQLHQLQRRIASLPRVEGAAFAWMSIFNGAPRAQRVALPGKPLSANQESFYRVSPGYFATLKTPFLGGRDFSPEDNDAAEPVPSIVNRAFARKYFGNATAIGREFVRDDGVRHRVIGLVANAYFGDLRGGPEPVVYFPMKPPRRFVLYVRANLDGASALRLIQREIEATGPGIHIIQSTSLDDLVGDSLVRERLLAAISGVFAFLGLLLAGIGLFGLLNYSVLRRTKEIGIRSALGAGRQEMVLLVFRDVLGMMAGGLVAGLAGALAILSFSRAFLFGIRPADPLVMGAAALVFLTTALLASGVPALRATRIDPMAALRED